MEHKISDYVQGVLEGTIIENAEMNLVRLFNAKLSLDGNMWCWLHGENLQDGIVGLGKSPYLAALDFNKNFRKELTS